MNVPSHVGVTGFEPAAPSPQRRGRKQVAETPPEPLAFSLARESQNCPEAPPSTTPPAVPLDADLARLIERWPALSATAKRMILAAVEAEAGGG